MDVSIAICTWNRARLLDQTLAAMCELRVAADITWELLVINNNCNDDTDAVTERYLGRLPLRKLWMPTPGKSYALNYAVREARGELILWTDDDALVYPDWVDRFVEGFRQRQGVDIFGGRVDPWFEVQPPDWFLQAWPAIKNAYAVREVDGASTPFTTKWPYGVNLAFRTAAHRHFQYDHQLGRQPGSTIGGEEVDLVKRMIAAGHQGWWLPQARVRHFIPKERLTIKYLRDYFYGIGLARANMWSKHGAPDEKKSLGRLRAKAALSVLKYHIQRRLSPPQKWARTLVDADLTRGWRDELIRIRRAHPSE